MESVRISVCGRDFSLKSANPEKLTGSAEVLNKKFNELSKVTGSMSVTDTVILSALDIADENNELHSLKDEIEAVKKQAISDVEKAQTEKISLEKAVESCNEEIASLKEKIATFEVDNEKYSNAEKQVETLTASVTEKDAEIKKLKEKLSSFEARVFETEMKFGELNGKLNSSKNENAALSVQNEKLNDELTVVNEKLSATEAKLSEAENSFKEITDSLNASIDENKTLSVQNEKNTAVINEQIETIEKLKAENETVTLKLSELNEAMKSASDTSAVYIRQAEEVEEQANSLRLQLEETEKQLACEKANAETRSNEIKTLLDKNADNEAKIEEYKKKTAELEALLDEAIENSDSKEADSALSEKIALLEAEKSESESKLNAEIDKINNEKYMLSKQIDELKAKLEELENTSADKTPYEDTLEIKTLKSTIETYEKAFEEYATQRNAEVEELVNENTMLKKKCTDLNNQLNEIVNDGQMTL